MKNEIILKDTEARIESIEQHFGFEVVILEWGGPSDREINDFELDRLGDVESRGTLNYRARAGWVVLNGRCNMRLGETIPLLQPKFFAVMAADKSGPAMGTGMSESSAWTDAAQWGFETDPESDAVACYEITEASYKQIKNGDPDAVEFVED